MRIDKFLKVSRLIKRREVAKQLCDNGDIFVNQKPAKPSSEVNEGDVLLLRLGLRRIEAKIISVKPFANKEQAQSMVEILADEKAKPNNS